MRIFDEASGLPGTLVSQQQVVANGIDTGFDSGLLFSVMKYDVTITPVSLNAQTYYLSVLEDDSSTTDTWLWSSSDPLTGNNSYFRFSDSNGWMAGTNDPKEAFELYGSCNTVVLGDVNLDGVVNLLDVAPFVDRISTGTFQAEADINQDDAVNLLDVQPYIDLLSG